MHQNSAQTNSVPHKGTPHNTNITVKMSLLKVWQALGGTEGMLAWAQSSEENLREFYRMYAKMIPRQTDITSNGEQLNLSVVRYVDAQIIDNTLDSLEREENKLLEDSRKLIEMSDAIVVDSQASMSEREIT